MKTGDEVHGGREADIGEIGPWTPAIDADPLAARAWRAACAGDARTDATLVDMIHSIIEEFRPDLRRTLLTHLRLTGDPLAALAALAGGNASPEAGLDWSARAAVKAR